MDALIDIHAHILPGIDDGAGNLEQSMSMLRLAKKNNLVKIIATPHYIPGGSNRKTADRIKKLELIKEAACRENIEIELFLGNEIYYRNEAVHLLEEGEIHTLAGSSYALTEFNPMQDYSYIRDAVYNLTAGGYRPVLAHVERYTALMEKKARIGDLIGMGAYIQINADSLLRKHGSLERKACLWMIKEEVVHFIATDMHDDQERPPLLYEAAKYIEKKAGIRQVQKLFCDNQEKLLNNEYI